MKKVFISQPMKGKSNRELRQEREKIIEQIKEVIQEPFEVLNTIFEDFEGSTPLKYVAKSLWVLSDADCAYFADGWSMTRGCQIEYMCANKYGIPIIKD